MARSESTRLSEIEASGAVAADRAVDDVDRLIGADRGNTVPGTNGATAATQLGAIKSEGRVDVRHLVPANPLLFRRTIRRTELRQIVPLANTTIYELERRGEFPRRFFLTARCVVWDLAEVVTDRHIRATS